MNGLLGNAVGYIKLQVSSDQADQAVTRLQRHGRVWGDSDDERALVGERCLACGESLPVGESKCSSCGWTYSDAIDDLSDEELSAAIESDDDEEAASSMDTLRGLKKPIFLFFLLPVILAGLVMVLLLVAAFLNFLHWLVT
jgi:hypothetical protein